MVKMLESVKVFAMVSHLALVAKRGTNVPAD